MKYPLDLTVLGQPHLKWREQPLTADLISSKGQALLIYLAMAGRAYSRSALAGLLWGDLPEERARANLRLVLNKLRQLVGDYLLTTRQTIAFNPDCPCRLDVAEFEALITTPKQSSIEQLRAAIALYRGNFLDDFQLPNAPDFEIWLMQERERLRRAFTVVLEQLISRYEQQGDLPAAIASGHQLLQHDPLHEATYRRLIQLYGLIGNQAMALRLYQTCESVLRQELGVAPAPLTRQAYQRLLNTPTPAPAAAQTAAPLIGREDSWQQLQHVWHSAANARPGYVWLIGEAGIGKTRLAEEFSVWASQQQAITAVAHCYAAEGHLSYAPVAQWLRADAIRPTLAALDPTTRIEVARLLPETLADHPGLPSPGLLTEGWQRQRFFEALARAILVGRQPLLLVLDDLQWCDQDTLEWVHYLLRCDSKARLVVIATLRPEEITSDHPLQTLRWQWGYRETITEIELRRLNVEETARLAASLTGQPLAVELTAQLYGETEGNPLFVVEIVHAGLGSDGNRPGVADGLRLPPRLQAVIAARLKRLSPFARELAGIAAAIGHDFDVEMLKQASQTDDNTLVAGLEELWQQQIIREQGAALYDFSHDKIREVAYARLSPARRQLIHRRIAQGLVQIYGPGPHSASNRIAAHYEQAGLFEQAIEFYRSAAMPAWALSAREVLAYLAQSLTLLQRLPETPQRDRLELDLLLDWGTALIGIRGNADPEVVTTFERARQLSLRMGGLMQIGPVLWGLWSFYTMRAQYDAARELAGQIRQMAQLMADPILHLVTDGTLGTTYLYLGRLPAARAHLERAIAGYQTAPEQCGPPIYPVDLSILMLPYVAWTLWLLGYPDQALTRCQAAIERARQLDHRLGQTYAHVLTTHFHYLRREVDLVRDQATRTRTLASSSGYDIMTASATIAGEWAEIMLNQDPASLAAMEQALVDWQANGTRLQVPIFLAMLAEAQAHSGQPTAALATLERALACSAEYGERFFEAELIRLQGELRLRVDGDVVAAAASFRRALAIAQAQDALSLALRAATSLSRLWQQQGQAPAARQLLVDIYNQFDEGFTTPDLRAAATLLAELS